MRKSAFSNLYSQVSTRVPTRELQRLTVLSQSSMRARGMFTRMAPKRNFSDSFERQVEKLSSLLPGGNIGLAVVALNTLFYGMYLMWNPYT